MGGVLGAVFGITSILNNTFNPSLLSFAFSPFYSLGETSGNAFSLVIALVPRILVGVIPYFVYHGIMKGLQKGTKLNIGAKKAISLPIACLVGSAVNTLLVMNLIYIGFHEEFATAKELPLDAVYPAIMAIIFANGIPEAIVAAIIGSTVSAALLRIRKVS
jgi:uncharacterized membrane protein